MIKRFVRCACSWAETRRNDERNMESSETSIPSTHWKTLHGRMTGSQKLVRSLADIKNALPQLSGVKSCAMIGCGSGHHDLDFVRTYLPNVQRLTAVEPDAGEMAALKTRVAQLLPDVTGEFCQETAENWKGADHRFDAVLLFHCLYVIPVPERPALFKKLFDNVLASGGLVFVAVSPCNMTENPTGYCRLLDHLGLRHNVDGVQVREMMASAGFRERYQLSKECQYDVAEPNDDLMSVFASWCRGRLSLEKVRQIADEFIGREKGIQDDVWFGAFEKP